MNTLRPATITAARRAATIAAFATFTAAASDWPQWRGPMRDGHAPGGGTKLDALPREAKALWSLDIGAGQASPVIASGRVIYLDEQAGQEVAHCVNLSDGKEVWRVAFDQFASWGNAYGAGPRSTPLVDGDRVYVQSCRGEFRCLALADGKTIWQTSFDKDWGASWFGNEGNGKAEAKETAARRHGNNGSAVIDGDRIFVPVGSPEKGTLVAFDKKSGKVLWTAGKENTAYSSVMVATLAGVRQVVHLTADALMGVDAAKGTVLWRVPVKTNAKRNIFTPLVAGDSVTVGTMTFALTKLKISKDSAGMKAEPEWNNNEVKPLLATPVLVGGHLFGIGTGEKKAEFVCVDFKTGELKWRQPGFGDYTAVIALGDKLLVQTSGGEMLLLRANPQKFDEIGRVQVCGNTWSHPAFADGTVVQRDKAKLFALELAK